MQVAIAKVGVLPDGPVAGKRSIGAYAVRQVYAGEWVVREVDIQDIALLVPPVVVQVVNAEGHIGANLVLDADRVLICKLRGLVRGWRPQLLRGPLQASSGVPLYAQKRAIA